MVREILVFAKTMPVLVFVTKLLNSKNMVYGFIY